MAACYARQVLLPSPCDSDVSYTDSSPFRTPVDKIHPKMADPAQTEDINVVLDDVIVKINRITDHLRDAGENEAANHLARDMTGAFQELYDTIAPWTIEQCLMTTSGQSMSPRNLASEHKSEPPSSASYTWAAIAATAPTSTRDGLIKFGPQDAVKRTVTSDGEQDPEHDSRNRRVVWIRPWSPDRSLSDVSKKMKELGAIYSIAYAPEPQAVCIIFQHAHTALEFLHSCAEHVARVGISPFGPENDVSPGLPYPMDDNIGRMDPPYNERRRLTFARAQLFSAGGSEARFRRDIEDLVGPSNIERLWLFNTGNATVVFSAVPLAKLVCETFRKHSRNRGHPYEGVQIPGHANYIGSNGSGNGYGTVRPTRSNTFSTDSSHNSRRPSFASIEHPAAIKRRSTGLTKPLADDDGWQTVKKRR